MTAASRQWGLSGLSSAELAQIHDAALRVLGETGVSVPHEEARQVFGEAGASVDAELGRVLIPPRLVEEALETAPSTVLLAGRDAARDVVLGDGSLNCTSFGVGLYVLDLETGEHRASTLADLADALRLQDILENADVVIRSVDATDLAENPAKNLRELETALSLTRKHVVWDSPPFAGGARRAIELAAAVAGGFERLRARPLMSLGPCLTSPLEIGASAAEIIIECARSGVPAFTLSMAMAGATSPVTLAGALVIHNAEVLSGLVLHQLTGPGAPFVYGSCSTAMDLYTGTSPLGSPEAALLAAGTTQLARSYDLPSFVNGGWADSKVVDAQAGHEKTLTLAVPALAGASLLLGMGGLELGMTLSFAQLVIDDEIAAMVKRVVRGIRVSDETLAVDLIAEVGPSGTFLGAKHTRTHRRAEQSRAQLFDRRMRGTWEKRGAKDLAKAGAHRAHELLQAHELMPLPPEVKAELRRIVRGAEPAQAYVPLCAAGAIEVKGG